MSGIRSALGRIAALALAAGAVALVTMGFILPFSARLSELEEDSRTAAAAIERLSARVRHRDSFAERLKALEEEVSGNPAHIQAETTSLGAAVLQGLLTEAAARQGVQVASTQVLPGARASGFERIVLRADIAGPYPSIAALLHGIESGVPFMFVDTIEIRPGADLAAGNAQASDVSVRLDVAAYMMEPPS